MPFRRLISALLAILVTGTCVAGPAAAFDCVSQSSKADAGACCCRAQSGSQGPCCASGSNDAVGCCTSTRDVPDPVQSTAPRSDGALAPDAGTVLYVLAGLLQIPLPVRAVSTPAFAALRDQQTWLRIARLTI